MAAAYAALMSLMHTSEMILHPSQQWLRLHGKQIESLIQEVRFLQEFLENYGRESCANELEELGKNIAIKCRGLPLAIVVIGGLLAKSNKMCEFWEYVVENLNSIINSGDDENCLKILYLSYSILPIHLKPCFLYMVAVLEGSGFSIGDLTRLWVAEGFLKPSEATSLEEVAYEYITY